MYLNMSREKHSLFSLKIYERILWAGPRSYSAILHFPKYPLFHFPSPLFQTSSALSPDSLFFFSYFTEKAIAENRHMLPPPNLPLTHILPSVDHGWLSVIQLLPSTQEHCPAIVHSPLCIWNICSLYSIISDNLLTWCNWAHHKKHPWLSPPSRPPTFLPFIIKREIIHEHDQISTSSLPILSWATSLRFPIRPLHWNCPCQGHRWPPFSISRYLFSILISPHQQHWILFLYNYSFFL